MKNYIITGGTDCDGFSKNEIMRFTTEETAKRVEQEWTEGGDGITYCAVDVVQAQLYAIECDLVMPDFAFNDEMDIVEL